MSFVLNDVLAEPLVRASLLEDLGRAGDITGAACVPVGTRFSGHLAARKAGVVAGLSCARLAFQICDPQAVFTALVHDGDAVAPGQVLATIDSDARAALVAERTALNLLCHLSGVASLTARYVQAVAGTRARIADTRKTFPTMRALQKHAVACGGGLNHRFGLDDAILIKDNHIAVCGGIETALERARQQAGHLVKIEVEVDTLDQLNRALPFKPDVILLDNFSLEDLAEAVRRVDGTVRLEASGGVSLETVAAIAATGVDVISVGALTHSAPVFDIGLDT